MKHKLCRGQHWFLAAVCWVFFLAWAGCEAETGPDLFDPTYQGRPTPSITTLSPDTALGGVTVVTITGTSFSSVPSENLVYFNGRAATVVTASATQLTVQPPVMEADSVQVKVAVFGAEAFSNTAICYLRLAVRSMTNFSAADEPWGIAADSAGNIYVSVVTDGIGAGVKKIDPAGTRSDYAAKLFETKYQTMRFGPDGALYACWNVQAIARIAGSMATPTLWAVFPVGTKIFTFDFDAQGNVWAGGSNAALYRVKPDLTVKSFPLNASVRSIRVFNSYLYVAGKTLPDSIERVVRYPIVSADSLGTQETYFNVATSGVIASNSVVFAINFAANGDMFVSTNQTNPLVLVHPAGSAEVFYPGLMAPTVHLLIWGKGTELLGVRGSSSGGAISSSREVYRINTQLQGTM